VSLGEAFQKLSVTFEESLSAAGEVFVPADLFDLSFKGVDDRALTLVPLTRATVSASSARSSGRRTVVCLVIIA
jgi:hypothetical protein